MRLNITVALKCSVNDASLVGIHRLKRYVTARSANADSDIFREILERGLAALAIVLGVKLDLVVLVARAVNRKAGQILKCVQRLAALADQGAHIRAFDIDVNVALFLVDFRGNLCGKAHCIKDLADEINSHIGRCLTACRLCGSKTGLIEDRGSSFRNGIACGCNVSGNLGRLIADADLHALEKAEKTALLFLEYFNLKRRDVTTELLRGCSLGIF